MNRRQSLSTLIVGLVVATSVLAPRLSEAARKRTHGLVAAQVYHEPRPGRRVKAPLGTLVYLYNASSRRLVSVGRVNKYGVASFSRMPLGQYYVYSLGRSSTRGTLRSARLLMQVKL